MALSAASAFAAFDLTAGAQELDISPILEDAIYYDLNFLGHSNVDFGSPVHDTTYTWNEEVLNADTFTTAATGGSAASDGTAIVTAAGLTARVHVGDLLYDTVKASTEVIQVTAITASTDTLTVVRGYGSTTQVAIASGATLAIMRLEQEASDIGDDKTLNPTVRSNYTSIIAGAFDLKISGSQLARKMATNEYRDFLARQLAARTTEFKISMTRTFVYSEKSASAGSDSVYRSMGGLRDWINVASGVTNASSEAISYAVLNLHNKSAVDLGVPADTLLLSTDLVAGVAAIDYSVRRLRESDTQVGYVVQEVTLNQGNTVTVVPDSRLIAGDAFMYQNSKVHFKPLDGRGMFVVAATDFSDARKRRILGEWTGEFRNPNAMIALRNKT